MEESSKNSPPQNSLPARLGHRPLLDGVRGCCIAAVLAYHLPRNYSFEMDERWIPGAFVVINVFFVLSGFLNARLLFDEYQQCGRISILRFYFRRALRLFPGLFMLGITWACYATWLKKEPFTADYIYQTLVYAWTFTMNIPLSTDAGGYWVRGFGHLWSLSVEGQFYLAVPILLSILFWRGAEPSRRMLPVLLLLVFVIDAMRSVSVNETTSFWKMYVSTPFRIDAPFVGVIAAVCMQDAAISAFFRTKYFQWLGFGALMGLAALFFSISLTQVRYFALGGFCVVDWLSAILLLSLVFQPMKPLSLFFGNPLARWLGRLSFSLYIWHLPVYEMIQQDFGDWSDGKLLLLKLGMTFAIAVPSYYFIERPALKLKLHWKARAVDNVGAIGTNASA